MTTPDTATTPRRYKPDHIYAADILDRINELTRPTHSRYTQILGYHRSYDHPVTVTHPSLLDQLHDAVTGTTGHTSNGATPFASKPAARISALDALARIEAETRHWIRAHDGTSRATPEGNLWWLAGALPTLTTPDLADLDHDTRSWHAGAAITSGWQEPAWRPHATCMSCGDRDTLRIRTDPLLGYCTSCGEGWDAATIGLLGTHVQQMLEQARTVTRTGNHDHDHRSGRGPIATDRPDLPGVA